MIPELAAATRVMYLHAHPDDESIQTGAMIAALGFQGKESLVLTATRGEQGETTPAVGKLDREELVALRESELANALDQLYVTHRMFLGSSIARAACKAPRRYEDSGMQWVTPTQAGPAADVSPLALTAADPAEVHADVMALIGAWRPEVLVSYADDGSYGHPDHVALHHITAAVSRATSIPFVEIVVDPNDSEATWVDFTAHQQLLMAALRCYESQLTVGPDGVTHVGGQIEPFHTRIGMRLHGA